MGAPKIEKKILKTNLIAIIRYIFAINLIHSIEKYRQWPAVGKLVEGQQVR